MIFIMVKALSLVAVHILLYPIYILKLNRAGEEHLNTVKYI